MKKVTFIIAFFGFYLYLAFPAYADQREFVQYSTADGTIDATVIGPTAPVALPDGRGQIEVPLGTATDGKAVDLATHQLVDAPPQ